MLKANRVSGKFDNFPSVVKSGGEVHKTRDFRGEIH